MESAKFLNKDALLIVAISLVLNFVFLFFYHTRDQHSGTLLAHGEVGYNVYAHNSVKINPKRMDDVGYKQSNEERRVDYSEIDHSQYSLPTEYRAVTDTIGFGVLLGLLWKITHSLRYLDVQILHVFIFSFLMFLFYQIALLLFKKKIIAFVCSCVHLAFFPIVYQNILSHRDIWYYYGVILLFYGVLSYLYKYIGYKVLVLCAFSFAIAQWMRPTLVNLFVSTGLILLLLSCFYRNVFIRIFSALTIFILVNIAVFWIPWCMYNVKAYDRPFVSHLGMMLLQGLGEYENPWGIPSESDDDFEQYMIARCNAKIGTPECYDFAKIFFWELVRQHPAVYLKQVLWRCFLMLFPLAPWLPNFWNIVTVKTTLKDKFMYIITFPPALIDFLIHYVYICLFFLCAYAGMILLLFRQHYFVAALLVFGLILPSWITVLSHIEPRFVVTTYAYTSLFAGYFISEIIIKNQYIKNFFLRKGYGKGICAE